MLLSFVVAVVSGASVSGSVTIEKSTTQEQTAHTVLQIACAATTPRLSWGDVHWYFKGAFDQGRMVEFRGGAVGFGERDQASFTLTSSDTMLGGASVFPRVEVIECKDLNDNSVSDQRNVDGPVVRFLPAIMLVSDKVANADAISESWPKEHIPVGRRLTACFLLDIHPSGTEQFLLKLESAGGTQTIGGPYTETDSGGSTAPCVNFTASAAGPVTFRVEQVGQSGQNAVVRGTAEVESVTMDPDPDPGNPDPQPMGCSTTGGFVIALSALVLRRRSR